MNLEWITPGALIWTAAIFMLRVTDMSLDTLRVLFVMRGRKGSAWISGFFQSALFVVAISSVLANLDNPLNIVAYAAGFATGNVVGILIENRLAIGFTHLRIISPGRGSWSRTACGKPAMPSQKCPGGEKTARSISSRPACCARTHPRSPSWCRK